MRTLPRTFTSSCVGWLGVSGSRGSSEAICGSCGAAAPFRRGLLVWWGLVGQHSEVEGSERCCGVNVVACVRRRSVVSGSLELAVARRCGFGDAVEVLGGRRELGDGGLLVVVEVAPVEGDADGVDADPVRR